MKKIIGTVVGVIVVSIIGVIAKGMLSNSSDAESTPTTETTNED